MEKKYLDFNLQIKEMSEEGSDFFYFSGYASTFGNVDRGNDVMVKGCFIESLKEIKPSLLWQHDMKEPIGVFEEIYETEQGLFVRGKMPKEDALVKGRVMPQMKCGSIATMSIGFTINKDGYEYDQNGNCLIKSVKLWEVSLVTVPMNPLAMVTSLVKSMSGEDKLKLVDSLDFEKITVEEAKKLDKRSFEKLLREAGVSKSAAVYLSSRTNLGQGEPVTDNESNKKAINEALSSINAIKLMLTGNKND